MINIILSSELSVKSEAEKVTSLLLNDELDFFHLNKPDFDFREMDDFLNQIDHSLHHKIMIHTHFSLINKYDLAGICLNKSALSQLAYADEVDKCYIQPMVLRNRKIEINRMQPSRVSYLANSMNEIQDLIFDADYVILSHNAHSFSNAEKALSLADEESLKMNLKNTKTKVISFGELRTNKEALLKELGFSGVASQEDFDIEMQNGLIEKKE